MKKILFLFITVLALSSCGTQTVQKTNNVPVEVMRLKEAQAFDTVLVIPASQSTYVFDKQGEYVGTYSNTTDGDVMVGVVMTIMFAMLLVTCGMVVSAIID